MREEGGKGAEGGAALSGLENGREDMRGIGK